MQRYFLKNIAKPLILSVSIALSFLVASNSLYAESVAVPVGQQGNNSAVDRPYNGLKKADVQRKYGDPISRQAAVGNPPISSWVYADYTVYFEYNVVIHSVITR